MASWYLTKCATNNGPRLHVSPEPLGYLIAVAAEKAAILSAAGDWSERLGVPLFGPDDQCQSEGWWAEGEDAWYVCRLPGEGGGAIVIRRAGHKPDGALASADSEPMAMQYGFALSRVLGIPARIGLLVAVLNRG